MESHIESKKYRNSEIVQINHESPIQTVRESNISSYVAFL